MGYKVMQIEVSNLCSLTCSYCPHPSQARPKGNMTFDTFKKCVELVRKSENPKIGGKQFVWLNHFGEPLLNPELSDFIKHAVARNIEVSFSSNGLDFDRQMFSRELWRSLADAGLRYVIVSAHERSAASLRKHVGDIIEIVETWQPKRSQLHDWAGQVDLGKLVPPMAPPVNSPCDYETNDMFAVTWDGRVAACCYDIEGRVGRTIEDVLEGDFTFQSISLCSTCQLGRGDADWLSAPLVQLQKTDSKYTGLLSKIRSRFNRSR